MGNPLTTIGFDADDTLWHNERFFALTQVKFAELLADYTDRDSLMEIDLLYDAGVDAAQLAERLKERLIARHGREDFTIITQDQMIEVLGDVLDVLTLAVGALGAISLLVGGIGILTIMTISINERTAEVGLLRALGAPRGQVVALFLGEAVILATIGGLVGLVIGAGGAWLIGALVPGLPTQVAWGYAALALLVAATIGLLTGVAPALRAAQLNPVEALRSD